MNDQEKAELVVLRQLLAKRRKNHEVPKEAAYYLNAQDLARWNELTHKEIASYQSR